MLGFSLKMRRPPKENRDGCKTVRLYCAMSSSNHNCKADSVQIEEQSGLKEEFCYFALSFKFVSESKTWILNDTFSSERLWHSHPFYHSYIEGQTPLSEKMLSDIELSPDKRPRVNQYLKNYKQMLSKLQSMDNILNHKAQGLLKASEPHLRRSINDLSASPGVGKGKVLIIKNKSHKTSLNQEDDSYANEQGEGPAVDFSGVD